jgi:hypothetical protein
MLFSVFSKEKGVAAKDLFCRSAALRDDLHPATRKPRVSGAAGLRRKESSSLYLFTARLRSPSSLRLSRAKR